MDSLNDVSVSEGIHGPGFEEAWEQAYPNPREFINHYTEKLGYYEERHKLMLENLTRMETQNSRVAELEAKVKKLQQAQGESQLEIMKMHELLWKERENYKDLTLAFENTKVECEGWRRKYRGVCYLTKTTEEDVAHFFQKNPNAGSITDKMAEVKDSINIISNPAQNRYALADPITLGKKLEVVEAQIPFLMELSRIKLSELEAVHIEDKAAYETRYKALKDEYDEATERHNETSALLKKSYTDQLYLEKKIREDNKEWIVEREHLVKMVAEANKQQFSSSMSPSTMLKSTVDNTTLLKTLKTKVKRLEVENLDLTNKENEYKLTILRLRKDLKACNDKITAESGKKSNARKVLGERIEILENRIREDEKRRKLDGAGFREDVKALKKTLMKLDNKMKSMGLRTIVTVAHLDEGPGAVNPNDIEKPKRCSSAPHPTYARLLVPKKNVVAPKPPPYFPYTNEKDKKFAQDVHKTYQKARQQLIRLAEGLEESRK